MVEETMLHAALAFLSTLDHDQETKALIPFDSEERMNWFYIPKLRAGLTFKAMRPLQVNAAIAMLKSGLSAKGMTKVETIRKLETVLLEIEKGSGPLRDPEMYYITIFGTPRADSTWGWRYEGHHTSLHWTIAKGKVEATTPQFLGSNPAEVRIEHAMKGTRVLGVEEDLGRAVVKSLDEKQLKAALISPKAPADMLTNNQRKASIQEDLGVAYKELTPKQQRALLAVLHEVADTQAPQLARMRMDKLKKAGYDSIKFAWMGGLEKGDPHYFRIQGKTFIVEHDNTQNDANHVHLVWRDFEGDFGKDILAEHYKSAGHSHGHDHSEG